MEEWDILTEDGSYTGETVERSRTALKNGQYHLVVHIWIKDSRGRVLIQQRSNELNILPGKWAITSGSAVSGEDAPTAAKRELFEELGIAAREDEFFHLKTYRGRNDIVNVYILNRSVSLAEIKMQYSEVQAVKWVSTDELRDMVAKKKFHAYNYLNELYEHVENHSADFQDGKSL